MWHILNTSDGVYIFTKFVTIEAERRSAHIIIEHYPVSLPTLNPFSDSTIITRKYFSGDVMVCTLNPMSTIAS